MPLRHIYSAASATAASAIRVILTRQFPDILIRRRQLRHQQELQKDRSRLMGEYYFDSDYVCTWPNGAVITPNYLTASFHKVISKSTLPHVRLHDLRHSAATNLLEMGFNVVQVAEWLGHESPNTTLKFYGHAVKSSKIEMANALDKVLKTP